MNIIVSNERKNDLSNLNIEVIKSVEGIHTVDELVGMFTNFFFNKMFLDVTSIKDYDNYSNLKKFFESIDPNKVIILLNDSVNNKEYISDLITLGVYNFTLDKDELISLFNTPRNYNDVSHLQIQKSSYDVNEEIDRDNNVIKDSEFTFNDFILPGEYDGNKKIIGVVNLTSHAGATTLVVQMVKQLNIEYKAIGIEMNKQDFLFFNTPLLYSCANKNDVLKKLKEHSDSDCVIVDLNDYDKNEFCTDIIYLIEPGNIKINKLLTSNNKIFEELSGNIIVLNRTGMDSTQVSEFEVEAKVKIFSVVSNFRDNLDRVISVDKLLSKLGYKKMLKDKKSLFGFLK